ncbi:MAG: RNA polymerase sigma factor [Bacteroidia bacterium]
MNPYHKSETDLQEELEWIRKAQADPDCFAYLYEKYYRSIFSFIYRRTDEEELTADLCSVTFLKAMLSIRKYEYRGVPFSAWLFRIAHNEVHMHYRKSKKDRCISLDSKAAMSLLSETEGGIAPDDIQQLLKALACLPVAEMELIELRFFEERPFAEVALITGITENNAKVKIYRILNKLKVFLTGRQK